MSRQAADPNHVSHYIHRIGYHFRSEVIDEASEQLGYISFGNTFVRQADLERQRTDAKIKAQNKSLAQNKSIIARMFAARGLDYVDNVDAPTEDPQRQQRAQRAQRETPEKVRAAISELFPKMPESDLDQIVEHSWEQGSDRVGTNIKLELPRRAQLATIARIRHMYTDYDKLLRAFDWADARQMVEQGCLQKLIEWRGEGDQGDDEVIEEIVRETIVIDDDDEDDFETDDEDVMETESDEAKKDDYYNKQSADEKRRREFDRVDARARLREGQIAIAKQKIQATRHKMDAASKRPHMSSTQQDIRGMEFDDDGNGITHVNTQPDVNGHVPTDIIVDGHRMRLENGHHVIPVSGRDQFARFREPHASKTAILTSLRDLPCDRRLPRDTINSGRLPMEDTVATIVPPATA